MPPEFFGAKVCPRCEGDGTCGDVTCPSCGGSGERALSNCTCDPEWWSGCPEHGSLADTATPNQGSDQ